MKTVPGTYYLPEKHYQDTTLLPDERVQAEKQSGKHQRKGRQDIGLLRDDLPVGIQQKRRARQREREKKTHTHTQNTNTFIISSSIVSVVDIDAMMTFQVPCKLKRPPDSLLLNPTTDLHTAPGTRQGMTQPSIVGTPSVADAQFVTARVRWG